MYMAFLLTDRLAGLLNDTTDNIETVQKTAQDTAAVTSVVFSNVLIVVCYVIGSKVGTIYYTDSVIPFSCSLA